MATNPGSLTTPRLRSLERSLVCARAAPAASLSVAVQVRQNVAPLADSPSLDELGDEPSPEGGAVALELVVSGHGANGTARPRRGRSAPPEPTYASSVQATSDDGSVGTISADPAAIHVARPIISATIDGSPERTSS